MKRASYQNGSVVRKKRSLGPDVWRFRYMDGDVQRSKLIGTVEKYQTKASAEKRADKFRQDINDRINCIKVSGLCDRFEKEGMPERESTSGPYRSYLKRVRAEWGTHRLDEMVADIMAMEQWLNNYKTLPTPDRVIPDRIAKGKLIPGYVIKGRPSRPASKKTKLLMKAFLHRMIELAIKWGHLKLQRNPVAMIEIKGKRERTRPLILITAEQWRGLITDPKLASHVRVMIYVAMLLGLRASEFLGLRWEDFDFVNMKVHIRRSYSGKGVDDTKTEESAQELPLHEDLVSVLLAWREEQTPVKGWLFGSEETGRPFWRGSLQKDHLIPAGIRVGLPRFGWHAFRHTYRAMMGEEKITLEEQRALMRHTDIRTTLSYGGKTKADTIRGANAKVVDMLRRA